MKRKIGVVVGSLRKDSYNRKLAKLLMQVAPSNLDMQLLEIGQLPLYNQDFDDHPPEHWVNFRKELQRMDGILFVTAEYNRSIPGVLKNAIDVGSRPYGSSSWANKPVAVISGSPGAIGGFGANQHLRQCFVFLDMPCMQMPEAYIGGIYKLFDEQGQITNEDTKKFLATFMQAYDEWLDTNLTRVV